MKGILILNKPSDWTSHDVVAKMRRILNEKRIGHGGTLDPMATGVLPLFIGRATRGVEYIESADKEYVAGLRLGIATDTQDITGTVLSEKPVNVSKDELEKTLLSFIGIREQVPPMYSAVKIGGKKLYEYARAGMEVERPPRRINIMELELLPDTSRFNENHEYLLRIVCSKGTYVRTICHEIGIALGCGAAMSSLVRTRVGSFSISSAYTLEQVQSLAQMGKADGILLPVESLFYGLDEMILNKSDENKVRNGVQIPARDRAPGKYRVMSGDGQFLLLGEVTSEGILRSVKTFFDT